MNSQYELIGTIAFQPPVLGTQHMWAGHPVCRAAWAHLLGVGKRRLLRCKRTFKGKDLRSVSRCGRFFPNFSGNLWLIFWGWDFHGDLPIPPYSQLSPAMDHLRTSSSTCNQISWSEQFLSASVLECSRTHVNIETCFLKLGKHKFIVNTIMEHVPSFSPCLIVTLPPHLWGFYRKQTLRKVVKHCGKSYWSAW